MSVTVFHAGAAQYGLLTSIMALGTVAGALLADGRKRPRFVLLLVAAAIFGLGFALAAVMPDYWLFGIALVIGFDLHQFNEQPDAIVHRACHAGACDGDSPRDSLGRHPRRRTRCRLGR